MKKLCYLLVLAVLITACDQKQRYFADSEEITTLKNVIIAYESGDMDAWRSHFADTAKIYHNTTKPISIDENIKGQQELVANFSTYGFDHEDEYIEMVKDKKDETWVYYWATWKGTLKGNGETITIPVHLAARFVDGKIVTEHGYWNMAPLENALKAMAEASANAAEQGDDAVN